MLFTIKKADAGDCFFFSDARQASGKLPLAGGHASGGNYALRAASR